MWFWLLLSGIYPVFRLGLFVLVIWPKRHDSEHVKRMAEAFARMARPAKRRK